MFSEDEKRAITSTARWIAHNDQANFPPGDTTLLQKVAHLLWLLGYRERPVEEIDVLRSIRKNIRTAIDLQLIGKSSIFFLETYVRDPSFEVLGLTLARWAECAFPKIVMTQKRAASLMATVVPKNIVEEMEPPWPSFVIEIPKGLLKTKTEETVSDVTMLLVHLFRIEGKKLWTLIARNEAREDIWRVNIERENLAGGWNQREDLIDNDLFDSIKDLSDLDERSMVMAGRLAAGTMLALSEPNNMRPVNKVARTRHAFITRNSPEPVGTRIFEMKLAITLDVSKEIERFISGNGPSPSVQTLVRGHWKRQACGPGLLKRKWINIEPYWRGPEDAPIAVRSHIL